jgi:hypothetical protein
MLDRAPIDQDKLKKEITSMEFTYKRVLAAAGLLALIAASSVLVSAQTPEAGQAPVPPVAMSAEPAVTGVIHVLKATYISTCLPNCPIFAIPAGTPVALDAVTTINCPAKVGKTCTITDDAWIELQNTSSTTNNPEALGFYVDGNDADFLYDGGGGTPGGFYFDAIAHKTAVAKVGPGKHTVQTQTYSVSGANGNGWTATYRVYVP